MNLEIGKFYRNEHGQKIMMLGKIGTLGLFWNYDLHTEQVFSIHIITEEWPEQTGKTCKWTVDWFYRVPACRKNRPVAYGTGNSDYIYCPFCAGLIV